MSLTVEGKVPRGKKLHLINWREAQVHLEGRKQALVMSQP
jgi:hypothetical protein